jgi:hypothetical protein
MAHKSATGITNTNTDGDLILLFINITYLVTMNPAPRRNIMDNPRVGTQHLYRITRLQLPDGILSPDDGQRAEQVTRIDDRNTHRYQPAGISSVGSGTTSRL